MSSFSFRKSVKYLAAMTILPTGMALVGVGTSGAQSYTQPSKNLAKPFITSRFSVTPILIGTSLSHNFSVEGNIQSERLTQPDDLTELGSVMFVAFQNRVGPQGQPSSSGNTSSTVVETTLAGKVLAQFDILGHLDGLTADSAHNRVVATVNEDANSSIFTITPSAPGGSRVKQYFYNQTLSHGGGTDAISIYHSQILVSASAPTNSNGPAVFLVTLDPTTSVATVIPVFFDNSQADQANVKTTGSVQLALTDPDSNAVVPGTSPRFPGDFVLDSQGDQQQIYVHDAGGPAQSLSVLNLSQSINDTVWVTDPSGVLYVTDHAHDTVDVVRGHMVVGTAFVAATPCDSNIAPGICPAAGYPANYLGFLDMNTGVITPVNVSGSALQPAGLQFVTN